MPEPHEQDGDATAITEGRLNLTEQMAELVQSTTALTQLCGTSLCAPFECNY